MTVIAAAVDKEGTVVMGADGVVLEGDICVRVETDPKVFALGDFLIGGSGSKRAIQILRFLCIPPPVAGPRYEYMVKEFVQCLRETMKENGGECESEDGDGDKKTLMDAGFLVAIDSQLFEIDSGYSVLAPLAPYYAIGCAKQEALAGMFTAVSLGVTSAREIVECGLRAAAEFDIKIRPPFSIIVRPKT